MLLTVPVKRSKRFNQLENIILHNGMSSNDFFDKCDKINSKEGSNMMENNTTSTTTTTTTTTTNNAKSLSTISPGRSLSIESLLDSLLVLYDECCGSSLRREKTVSDFIELCEYFLLYTFWFYIYVVDGGFFFVATLWFSKNTFLQIFIWGFSIYIKLSPKIWLTFFPAHWGFVFSSFSF